MKIWSVGADLFHADGRTDTTKLIVAFLKLREHDYKTVTCTRVWFNLLCPDF